MEHHARDVVHLRRAALQLVLQANAPAERVRATSRPRHHRVPRDPLRRDAGRRHALLPAAAPGRVAAGVPILATENIEESICLPRNYFSNDDLFILKVAGDSMINSGILDGDKIIVKKQNTAQNGEIVVALLEDSATVKRFFKEANQIRLQPENDFLSPIYCDTCDILGVVVGLIRKF